MKLITLHDNLNPNREVILDADSISGISPSPSGSFIQCGGVMYNVEETPEQVKEIIDEV